MVHNTARTAQSFTFCRGIDLSLSRERAGVPRPRLSVFWRDSAGLALVALDLDHKVGEFRRAIEQELMRHLGGDADHIARGELLPDAALNGSVTFFMRFGVFRTHQGAAHYERCRTGLHEENVGLILVPFRHAVG